MFRPVVGVLAVVLLVAPAVSPAAAVTDTASLQTPDGFEETTFRVTVYANGSATWAIEHQTPLRNESEEQQFQAFADSFERNETDLYTNFVEQAGLLTQYGTNTTGREMSARNFQRTATTNPVQNTGTVRMSFLWEGFATTRGDRVVVSDVFEGGFYIGPDQSFVVERGPTLAFVQAQPPPDSRSRPDSLARSESVSWVGETSFADRRPYVELGPRSAVVPDTPTEGAPPTAQATTQTDVAAGPDDDTSGVLWQILVGALVLALGVVVAAIWRSGVAATAIHGGTTGGGSAAQTPEPDSDSDGGVAREADPAVSDEELLSDNDRVIQLLEENGGRMKQVDIVDTTGWSKSKVSMLLSEMEDDGEISKLRVGRENIISIAGQEPDAAGSPFEEE
ncbi:helix-turn-helix transcriptional regulator [Haloarcula marina]|uniref:helix-turn-helix transcriptional regulator n=1 Tax=Haloarcula marina TaxID=2961574 RepID=UPI0020B63C18|nr:helix-turn-helix domain-containing protein [Halomicroarcula marina]